MLDGDRRQDPQQPFGFALRDGHRRATVCDSRLRSQRIEEKSRRGSFAPRPAWPALAPWATTANAPANVPTDLSIKTFPEVDSDDEQSLEPEPNPVAVEYGRTRAPIRRGPGFGEINSVRLGCVDADLGHGAVEEAAGRAACLEPPEDRRQ
jgi:hypothetical protein